MRALLPLAVALLLAACLKIPQEPGKETEKVSIGGAASASGDVLEIQTVVTGIPRGDIVVETHGKEVGLAYGAIAGTGETSANGIATAHYLEDGSTVIGVQVNIAAAQDGFFYEAWLSQTDTPQRSIGHLTNAMNDVRHSVRFEGTETHQKYKTVLITREADDGDPMPAEVIAIGILKPTSR